MLNWFRPQPKIGQAVRFHISAGRYEPSIECFGTVVENINMASSSKCKILIPKQYKDEEVFIQWEDLDHVTKAYKVLYGNKRR